MGSSWEATTRRKRFREIDKRLGNSIPKDKEALRSQSAALVADFNGQVEKLGIGAPLKNED